MTRAIAGVALVASAITIHAADPPRRKPLDPKQRAAVLAMVKAVELAQATDVVDEGAVEWDSHVFKSGDHVGYVPFRVGIPAGAGFKPSAMYVRAVSRHDGTRAVDEHSRLREWLLKGGDIMPRMAETAYVGTGEMPVGGIANGSSRQATAAAAAASGALMMQMKDYEKQKKASESRITFSSTRGRTSNARSRCRRASTTCSPASWTAIASGRPRLSSSNGP